VEKKTQKEVHQDYYEFKFNETHGKTEGFVGALIERAFAEHRNRLLNPTQTPYIFGQEENGFFRLLFQSREDAATKISVALSKAGFSHTVQRKAWEDFPFPSRPDDLKKKQEMGSLPSQG